MCCYVFTLPNCAPTQFVILKGSYESAWVENCLGRNYIKKFLVLWCYVSLPNFLNVGVAVRCFQHDKLGGFVFMGNWELRIENIENYLRTSCAPMQFVILKGSYESVLVENCLGKKLHKKVFGVVLLRFITQLSKCRCCRKMLSAWQTAEIRVYG